MDLSPLGQIAGLFEGAPTLSDFAGVDPVANRVRGSARQFVQFYKKKVSEMVCVSAKNTPMPLSIVVQQKPEKYEVRHVEKLMVRIITPGDKNEIDDVATDEHKREHWKEYTNFMNGVTAPVGTPVTDPSISFISAGMATEMMRLHIYTLEQFAESTDEACKLLGADAFPARETARIWLQANEQDESKIKMSELEQKAAAQELELAQMREQMSRLLDARGNPIESESVKRGRPKKGGFLTPEEAQSL